MTDLDSFNIHNLNLQIEPLFIPCNQSQIEHDNINSLQNSPKLNFFSISYDKQQISSEMKQYEEEIPDIFLDLNNIQNIYGSDNNSYALNCSHKNSLNEISKFENKAEQSKNQPPKLENQEENEIKRKKLLNKKNSNQKKAKIYKNVHRYLSHQIINKMLSSKFFSQTLSLCQNFQIEYDNLKEYFYSKIETFNSLSILSEHWTIEENNYSQTNQFKKVFRVFSKWFLQEKATRYILNGKMKDKIIYLEYKNKVMNYFIDYPEKYLSNQIM